MRSITSTGSFKNKGAPPAKLRARRGQIVDNPKGLIVNTKVHKNLCLTQEVVLEELSLTRTKTPEKLLMQFDPTPSRKVQEKIDFFFAPYNQKQSIAKSMMFADGNDDEELLLKLRSLSDDPYLSLKERDHVKVSM